MYTKIGYEMGELRARFLKKIQDWIVKSKNGFCISLITKQINPRSLASQKVKKCQNMFITYMVSQMLQNSTTYYFNKNIYSTSTKIISFNKNIYSTSTKIISFKMHFSASSSFSSDEKNASMSPG